MVLQAAGGAFVERCPYQALNEAERVVRHRVHAIAFGETVDAGRTAVDAVAVAREEKDGVDTESRPEAACAKTALRTDECVRVEELLKGTAMRFLQFPSTLRTLCHLRKPT